MKRPIKSSQLLFYSSIFSIIAFMLAINHVFIENKPGYFSLPADEVEPLKLTNKTLVKHKSVAPFSSIRISTQFLDTIIFEPSDRHHLEIKGDQSLVNNLRFYFQTSNNELVIERINAFWADSLRERAYYDFNFKGVLEKGGLNIKVYYTKLKDISVHGEAKFIVQKGTLQGSNVIIDACADEAYFNVDAKNVDLHLLKPCWIDTFGKSNKSGQKSSKNDFHVLTGKADLVQVNPQYGSSWVDLSKLRCRHVHGVLNGGGGSKKIIAAPSQLLSYYGNRPLPLSAVEVVCKSKAKVSYAYEDPITKRTIHAH